MPGRVALEHYQTGVAVELKADASPVTRADRGAEQVIRQAIARRYPDHAVVGEEYGADGRASAFRWIVDPIDGTKSFIRGVPLFGVLVALEIDGRAEVGVCHMPALGETVAAATGLGCTWNGRTARVSTVDALGDATVVYSDGRMLSRRLGRRMGGVGNRGRVVAQLGRLLRPLPGRDRARRRDAGPGDERVGLRGAAADRPRSRGADSRIGPASSASTAATP